MPMWMTIVPIRDRRLLASYARAFAAAVLTLYLAGETDLHKLFGAGLAAIVPPLLRWLNPNDPAFGRGSTSDS